MKFKFIVFVILNVISTYLYSQNISVKSFRMLQNDMDARINKPKEDQNGEKCAIIKVVTTEQGFVWEGDALGIVKTDFKTSEYWLYVPHGAKRLTIKHSQLGMLRDYIYPVPIKEATVYEMVLTTAKVTTIVEEYEVPTQWVVITSKPNVADVFINEQYVGVTPYQVKMEVGSYNYRIEKSMYHSEAGKFKLTDEERTNLTAKLKPNFGYIKINTTPEQGAYVEIDGKTTNSTPYTSQQLLTGKHRLSVKKVMFKPKTIDFTISDGQTTTLSVDLEPNFASININTTPEADIYIDDIKKGNGSITERLNPGLHTFEARKNKHYSDKKQQEFTAGETVNLSLHVQAKSGKVDITSTPFDATIKLNGKNYGTTPNTLKDLLIGNYILTLEKQGYGTISKTITITENQTVSINETLPSGKQVNIGSTPSGAQLSVDGTNYGTTPQTITLAFGNHTLKLVNGKKTVEQNITISQSGKTSFSFDVSELSNFTKTTAGLNIKMVAVQGGSFKMGSNDSDDEKPIHTVTVNDFYIGKYEVTQAQWKAIMGNNPSYFKGNNLPVENVSWNDIQEFIQKLNAKTGKNYRLPTEAEWEYAARGGAKSRGYKYSGSNSLGGVAWYNSNSNSKTHSVGQKQANELGIYDMSGNVWEWCSDWYDSKYYKKSPAFNPQGPSSGSIRVFRGGSWDYFESFSRVAYRSDFYPGFRYFIIGFRLALSSR